MYERRYKNMLGRSAKYHLRKWLDRRVGFHDDCICNDVVAAYRLGDEWSKIFIGDQVFVPHTAVNEEQIALKLEEKACADRNCGHSACVAYFNAGRIVRGIAE